MSERFTLDPCCRLTLERQGPDGYHPDDVAALPDLQDIVTCECGRSWSRTPGKSWTFHRLERRCVRCGHWSCPCCNDSCDQLLGPNFYPCCDGECTYTETTTVH